MEPHTEARTLSLPENEAARVTQFHNICRLKMFSVIWVPDSEVPNQVQLMKLNFSAGFGIPSQPSIHTAYWQGEGWASSEVSAVQTYCPELLDWLCQCICTHTDLAAPPLPVPNMPEGWWWWKVKVSCRPPHPPLPTAIGFESMNGFFWRRVK